MEDFMNEANETLIPFVNRLPRAFEKAEGHVLYTADGKKTLDFTAGIAVVNLGHNNRRVNDAIRNQLDRITHISNVFYIPGQAKLSKLISEKSFKGKSFFCNSGAEANETALKLARFVQEKKSPSKNKLLSLSGSFHGRTIATITLTGQPKYKNGFSPLLGGIEIVDRNNIRDLEDRFDDDVAAIFLEAIQGEGGIVPLTKEFVAAVKELAKKHDALVIFDEVQTGIGRTGKYFGYQWHDIEPDMITMAKALGNGFPIGGIHVRGEVADMVEKGLHMSTFGGNYLAMAAGVAVMEELDDSLLKHVNDMGAYIMQKANALKAASPDKIGEIRGSGLMIAIDLKGGVKVGDVMTELLERGIAILRAGENAIRLVPPFTIGKAAIDILFAELENILQ